MSAPGLFSDISKAAEDLIKKGHVFDNKVSLKAKAANGAVFSSESTVAKASADGKEYSASKVALKFTPFDGVNVSKIELTNRGRVAFEADTSFEGYKAVWKNTCGTPGLDPSKNENFVDTISMEVQKDFSYEGVGVSSSLGYDVVKKTPLFNALASYEGFLLGGHVIVAEAFKGVTDFDVAGGYQADSYRTVVKFNNKKSKYDFSWHQKVNATVTLAATAAHTVDKLPTKDGDKKKVTPTALAVGGTFTLDGDSKINAAIDHEAQVSLSFVNNVRKGVELTLSAGVDGKTAAFTKGGAGLAFAF